MYLEEILTIFQEESAMKKVFILSLIILIFPFAFSVGAAPINSVDYSLLTGTELIDFEDLTQVSAPGTNYDVVFASGGVGFGESFTGQTVTYVSGFDQLSGAPTGGLSLQTGVAGENINVFAGTYNGEYGNVLNGLGPVGFPDFNAIGEGSFAMLFSTDQSEFGFEIVGGNGGNAYIDFFARNGSLIDSIILGGLADIFYGFSREGGVQDIAGISIWNDDLGGIGIDDILHDVTSNYTPETAPIPEPSTFLLLGGGLAGLAFVARRRKKE
jgi:hypothetical protein